LRSKASPSFTFGIDFGTTNSSLALASAGEVELARFSNQSESFRSILYAEAKGSARTDWFTGPEAIGKYLEAETKGRLIQSLKSFLSSRSLTSTQVFGRRFRLEELIAIFLKSLRKQAEAQFGAPIRSIVAGRPVRFVGSDSDADDEFALARLEESFLLAGFEQVSFEMEPIAAAWFYANRLDHEEVLLVGDFGGGTSDFSLLRVGPGRRDLIGNAGVGLAGDSFDSRLIRHVVSPALGLGGYLRSLGKRLPIPVWLYANLERWHHLSLLRNRETLQLIQSLIAQGEEREKLQSLYHLVNEDLGYRLHQAVQQAKRELSSEEETRFRFEEGGVDIDERIRRVDFEQWIAGDLADIETCVNGLMARSGIEASAVDRVFLTGGTSFVPSVRRIFTERFGADKIRSGGEFTSIAHGLSLRAAQPEN
jgi:hypothetical chaperone protein